MNDILCALLCMNEGKDEANLNETTDEDAVAESIIIHYHLAVDHVLFK